MQINSPAVIQQKILETKFLPLFTSDKIDVCKTVLYAAFNAGIRGFEFTNRHQNSFVIFKELEKICSAELPGMQLGIGTIKNAEQAQQFIDAGAHFLVSPLLLQEIADVVKAANILWIPGCATASEIGCAENWGLNFVKIFPAKQLGGPAFIKAMKEVFPKMHMLATGGVEPTRADLQSWFNAGTDAVGIGSKLFSKELIEANDEKKLTANIVHLNNYIAKSN